VGGDGVFATGGDVRAKGIDGAAFRFRHRRQTGEAAGRRLSLSVSPAFDPADDPLIDQSVVAEAAPI
jgi:hypothetical protein